MPLAYALELELDPGQRGYRGQVVIDVRVARPVGAIWLHADELDLERAALHQGGAVIEVSGHDRHPGAEGLVRLALAGPAAAGRARLVIDFRGRYQDRVGVFRRFEGGVPYVYTDFEPIDARRAFPCFDEPRFKTPWAVSLVVPEGARGLSNMPARVREPLSDGRTRIRFAPTRPLPSYLVAFAAGPFELIELNGTSVPMRLVVPRGKAAWAATAAATAPPLLTAIEAYMGAPSPFPKLDLVAVPDFGGAMENPGLITVAAHILLADPARPAIPQQRFMALVCAHEFAHLWFGDLVTPGDWRDLWLNEGLATWLADKALLAWRPERRPELDQVVAYREAMALDRALDARAVRQPVYGRAALGAIFDAITYKKGGALIAMLEAWVGEDAFRRALRAYVAEHADEVVTAADLMAAVQAVSERPVAATLSSFLDQPGYPLVSAETRCSPGAHAGEDEGASVHASVTLSQRRYLPLVERARAGAASPDPTWKVPVCVRYDRGGDSAEACTVLDQPSATLTLDTATCPRWLVPNAGGRGYYQYRMPADQLVALARAPLDGREATELAHTVRALLDSGDLEVAEALQVAGALAVRSERHVHEPLIELFSDMARYLVTGAQRERFRAYLRRLYRDHMRTLGVSPRPGESEEDTLRRLALLGFVGEIARIPEVVRELRASADTWLRTGSGIAPGLIEETLRVVAATGDAALFDRLERELRDSGRDVTRQAVLIAAVGSFTEPALIERALDLVRDTDLELPLRYRLLLALLRRPRSVPLVLDYLRAHEAAIADSDASRMLLLAPLLGAGLCSQRGFEQARGLAQALSRRGAIAPERLSPLLSQSELNMRTCLAFRERHGGLDADFFR
ncbi:M1 family metallopeptidase [Haliangium sp.]|uniref:M1 family metallopeptidase n=1 Tax=Haliangium sp. TaxID=2663208 RepID=UPI003D0D074B